MATLDIDAEKMQVRVVRTRMTAIEKMSEAVGLATEHVSTYLRADGIDGPGVDRMITEVEKKLEGLYYRNRHSLVDAEECIVDHARAKTLGRTVESVRAARRWHSDGVPVREIYFESRGGFEWSNHLDHSARMALGDRFNKVDYRPLAVTLFIRKPSDSRWDPNAGQTVTLDVSYDMGDGKWVDADELVVGSPNWSFVEAAA